MSIENENSCSDQLQKCSLKYINVQPYIKKQMAIALCLNMGHFLIGFTIGWSAPMIVKLQDPAQTPLSYLISSKEASWVASVAILGSIFGSNIAGYISNKVGRKPCLTFFSVITFVGYVLITVATRISMIYAGRTIANFGLGGVAILNIVYIGEIASPNIRGVIMALTGIVHIIGSLVVYSIGPYVSYAVVGYVALIIILIYIFCGFWIPESPVYHVIRGNEEAAKHSLRLLGRDDDINKELKTMIENVKQTQYAQPETNGIKNDLQIITRKWTDILSDRVNRKSLFITGTLFISQNLSGVIVIIMFATTIFKAAKSSVNADLGTIILGLTELCGAIVTPLLIEKFGRKILLLTSSACCSICMALLGTYFYLDYIKHTIILSIGWLPLFTTMLCLFSFNFGIGIIPNTLLGEMYSPNIRSTGSSISMTLGWMMSFTSNVTFGYIISAIGSHFTFWIYAVINAFAFIFTVVVVPETKGKSLTEIQAMLAR